MGENNCGIGFLPGIEILEDVIGDVVAATIAAPASPYGLDLRDDGRSPLAIPTERVGHFSTGAGGTLFNRP